jgi:hypothetical protein
MSEPINPVPTQPNPDPITAHVGGRAEGAPVSVPEAQVSSVAEVLQPSGEHVEPDVPAEVQNIVKVNRDLPQLDQAAQAAGVQQSHKAGSFVPPVFQNVTEAERVAKSTKTRFSLAWISDIIAKNFKRVSRQEAH